MSSSTENIVNYACPESANWLAGGLDSFYIAMGVNNDEIVCTAMISMTCIWLDDQQPAERYIIDNSTVFFLRPRRRRPPSSKGLGRRRLVGRIRWPGGRTRILGSSDGIESKESGVVGGNP